MLHQLRRHPIPIRAFFRSSLVLTYAFPAELLEPNPSPVDRFTHHDGDTSDVVTARQFGHHPAVGRVQCDLASHDVGMHEARLVDDGGGGFVARRLDA